jgi:hypothetical protein
VSQTALGKEGGFAECDQEDTRQRSSPSAREKVLGKEVFADALFTEPSLPSVTLGKAFAECF